LAQVLRKEYECYTCHRPILISKIDNPQPDSKKRWEQWEIDGVTLHQCKKEHQQKEGSSDVRGNYNINMDNDSQIADLAKQVSNLKDTVNVLISQIQMLRSELKK
jgi:hypothetical protein